MALKTPFVSFYAKFYTPNYPLRLWLIASIVLAPELYHQLRGEACVVVSRFIASPQENCKFCCRKREVWSLNGCGWIMVHIQTLRICLPEINYAAVLDAALTRRPHNSATGCQTSTATDSNRRLQIHSCFLVDVFTLNIKNARYQLSGVDKIDKKIK